MGAVGAGRRPARVRQEYEKRPASPSKSTRSREQTTRTRYFNSAQDDVVRHRRAAIARGSAGAATSKLDLDLTEWLPPSSTSRPSPASASLPVRVPWRERALLAAPCETAAVDFASTAGLVRRSERTGQLQGQAEARAPVPPPSEHLGRFKEIAEFFNRRPPSGMGARFDRSRLRRLVMGFQPFRLGFRGRVGRFDELQVKGCSR